MPVAGFVGMSAGEVDVLTPTVPAGLLSAGATEFDVVVTTGTGINAQTSSLNAPGDQYLVGPVVKSLSVSSGLTSGGTSVKVNGTGFQNDATVAMIVPGFAPIAASASFKSTTEIDIVTPPVPAAELTMGQAKADLVVTEAAGAVKSAITANDVFVYGPLQVLSLDHEAGPFKGGTVVTLTGTGFTNAINVAFDPGSSNLPPLSAVPTVIDDDHVRITTPPFTGTPLSNGSAPYDLRVVVNTGTGTAESPANPAHDLFTYGQGFTATATPGPWPSAELRLQGLGFQPSQQVPILLKNQSDGQAIQLTILVADQDGSFDLTLDLTNFKRMCQVDVRALDSTTSQTIANAGPALDGGVMTGKVQYAEGKTVLEVGSVMQPAPGQGAPLKTGDELCAEDGGPDLGVQASQQPGSRLIYTKGFASNDGLQHANYGVLDNTDPIAIQGTVDLHPGPSVCLEFSASKSVVTSIAGSQLLSGPCPTPQPHSGSITISDPTAIIPGVQTICNLPSGGKLSGFAHCLSGGVNDSGELTLDGAVYYVIGNVTINGGLSGDPGTLLVNGTLTIHGPINFLTEDVEAFLTTGDIVLDPNGAALTTGNNVPNPPGNGVPNPSGNSTH